LDHKYVVLFTRNLNSPENYQEAVSTLDNLPGVREVFKEDDEPGALSTRLVVGYSSIETSPEMLISELNSLGYPVVMQEERGEDALHIDPSRHVIPDGGYEVGKGRIMADYQDSGSQESYSSRPAQ